MQAPNNMMNQDMQRMQQEAIRRVQEMQSRARGNIEPKTIQNNINRAVNHNVQNNRAVDDNDTAKPKENVKHKEKQEKKDPITNIFDSLMKDYEKTLIIVLILILVSENADISIILALMYLII